MSQGILYVATDDQFVQEAAISARSVKNSMDIDITLITDKQRTIDVFDTIVVLENPAYDFIDKIYGMIESPYDETLYLDTDTYIEDDIYGLFDLLGRFDLAGALNHNHITTEITSVPETFPEYNTGVLAYGSESLDGFLEDWLENHKQNKENYHGDQESFRETLYHSELRVATIPPEYNCMVRYPGHAREKVRVFHGRLIDLDTMGSSVKFDTEQAVKEINRVDDHRVFYPSGGLVRSFKKIDSVPLSHRFSLIRRGAIFLLPEPILSKLRERI